MCIVAHSVPRCNNKYGATGFRHPCRSPPLPPGSSNYAAITSVINNRYPLISNPPSAGIRIARISGALCPASNCHRIKWWNERNDATHEKEILRNINKVKHRVYICVNYNFLKYNFLNTKIDERKKERDDIPNDPTDKIKVKILYIYLLIKF